MKLLRKVNANPKYQVELTHLEAMILWALLSRGRVHQALLDVGLPVVARIEADEDVSGKLHGDLYGAIAEAKTGIVRDLTYDPLG